MAEEVQTPAAPAQQQAPNPIQSQLQELGGFMTPEDKAALENLIGGEPEPVAPAQPAQPAAAKPEGDKTPEQTEADKLAEKAEADKVAAEKVEAEKVEKKGPLGLKKKPAPETVIEKPEQILELIKSKFGQEYKDIKETPKFFESAQGWRKDSEKLKTVESELGQIKKEISELPEDIHEVIDLYVKGQDYTTAFGKKSGIDLNTPFDKQDKKGLVEKYFPGKFTEEDFKEETKSELLKMAEDSAKIKFEAEKQVHDNKRATVSESAKKALEAQKAAAGSSVSNLKQRFPDMDEEIFNDVKSLVEGGPQKVLSFFFNPDGTVKPDAATRLTMAKHYESIMEEAAGAIAHVAETQTNEEILTRGADSPKPTKPSGKQEDIPEELKKQIKEIEDVGNRTSKRTF